MKIMIFAIDYCENELPNLIKINSNVTYSEQYETKVTVF